MKTGAVRVLLVMTACLLACGGAGTERVATTTQAAPAVPEKPCPLRRDYEPHRAQNGATVTLPAVPVLAERETRSGNDFTVWGASFYLRSEAHRLELSDAPISVVGYITRTNLPDAPRCAVHRGGKADPENCFAPVPTFWLGDTKDAPQGEAIKVMGWASNYAQIHDAMLQYDSKQPEPYLDTFWGVEVPNPLPAAGARVRVTGGYARRFVMASTGAEDDPVMGIVTATKIELLEPAPDVATLPGMKRNPR